MLNQDRYIDAFHQQVELKYRLYNSLFRTLPFSDLAEVGAKLSVFNQNCQNGLQQSQTPKQIINQFFQDILHSDDRQHQVDVLFLILQFVEREVVLFDALEDASYPETHDLHGDGSLTHLINQRRSKYELTALYQHLKSYHARIVLTAHPTQFYPPQVLSIIEQLTGKLKGNELRDIYDLLLQMGKTSFRNDKQPTPYDEARILIRYLRTIFYPVYKRIHFDLHTAVRSVMAEDEYLPPVLQLGFWPGGDRDGNPNVTPEITAKVAADMQTQIKAIYVKELTELKQRLTFPNMWQYIDAMRNRLQSDNLYQDCEEFILDLKKLKQELLTEQQGFFVDEVEALIIAAQTFGFYFSSIDLRQDSGAHTEVMQQLLDHFVQTKQLSGMLNETSVSYTQMSGLQKLELLKGLLEADCPSIDNEFLAQHPQVHDCIGSLRVAQQVQQDNGERGMHRYIISNTQGVHHIVEVMLLAYWAGWSKSKINLDIVPLFETVEDLQNSYEIMQSLLELPIYQQHLQKRNQQQTVMLGFSDGTKDGGYVTANCSILECKQRLSQLAQQQDVEIIFFDGRGGPPSRGGGETHQFYRACQSLFEQHQVQLTIQGQTISTNFSTPQTASYHVEQLLTSGIPEQGFQWQQSDEWHDSDYQILKLLADISFESYSDLKQDEDFVAYLEQITPLNYYGELNIASRPPRRGKQQQLQLSDLRAIPFVGAWSQMKQNVPGYYGLGSALQQLINDGKEAALSKMYQRSLFFRTLLHNAMQSLSKSNFALTSYLQHDQQFSRYWHKLKAEADLTERMLLQVSGEQRLLEHDQVLQRSIDVREHMVLPLLVIQQFAMQELREEQQRGCPDQSYCEALQNLILKSLAANINASRNSA